MNSNIKSRFVEFFTQTEKPKEGVMKKYLLSLIIGGVAVVMSHSASAECGSLTVAEMNWASAELMANVDKIILKPGYGCDAELVPGDTMPTGTSMIEKGEPDIAPEMWSNAFADASTRLSISPGPRSTRQSISPGPRSIEHA